MKSEGLEAILREHFDWNKARLCCFAGMILALVRVRTVNLVELAGAFESEAQVDSRYKRLKRFFRQMTINLADVTSWVIVLFGLDQQAQYLSMDRTNWKWGQQDINFLVLSVLYKGTALPVVWSMIPTQGNSDTASRIVLMQKWINCFGKAQIAGVLGDREFIGDEWLAWLKKENIPFCIRIKKNILAANRLGKPVPVKSLFQNINIGEQLVLPKARKVWNQSLYLSGLRLPDGELLIVVCDRYVAQPIDLYKRRWEIETLFGCLKSKGFHFEDTRMVEPARLSNLMALLTITFCWMHRIGEWHHAEKPIRIKKHGRLAQSLFRYGLDMLRDVLINPSSPHRKLRATFLGLLSKKVRHRCT